MNQIENTKRATRRQACMYTPGTGQRQVPAIAEARERRSPGSQVRAANAVIDEYARGVATGRVQRQATA
jgi:hypothetical protein